MSLKRKFIAIAITTLFAAGISNGNVYAKTNTVKTTEQKKDMTKEVKDLMVSTAESAKALLIMGNKMIKDGNTEKNGEKMMMGAKIMKQGMMLTDHSMMNKGRKIHGKNMMSQMGMTKEIHNMMKKMAMESSTTMMKMGNTLVKEGNTGNDGQKMMMGGEMVNIGMTMHNMGMNTVMINRRITTNRNGKVTETEEIKMEMH